MECTKTIASEKKLGVPSLRTKFWIFVGKWSCVSVGDEALRIADWQFGIEDRIRRLEEGIYKNQDILMELRTFENSITVQPRYRKNFTTAYDSGSGISIWGLGSGDGFFDWGSGKWGEDSIAFPIDVDQFIQQFNDSYTENFIDTDFLDSAETTSTWSGNGQLIL